MQVDHPITIIFTLFIVLLLVFFLVVPEYKTFMGLQTELSEQKAEFNAKYDYYAAIDKAHFELQSRQEDITKIDDALPSGFDLGQIIYTLQKNARESGLMVKDLFLSRSSASSITTKEGTNTMKDIVFSIDLLGNYKSLQEFIISLEKSTRIFEVTSISFGTGAGQLSQSFSLQVKTHSY